MNDMDMEERASEMEALRSMFPEELRVMGDETFELDVTGSAGLSLMLRCSLPPGGAHVCMYVCMYILMQTVINTWFLVFL